MSDDSHEGRFDVITQRTQIRCLRTESRALSEGRDEERGGLRERGRAPRIDASAQVDFIETQREVFELGHGRVRRCRGRLLGPAVWCNDTIATVFREQKILKCVTTFLLARYTSI